jgi:hypothetical protein
VVLTVAKTASRGGRRGLRACGSVAESRPRGGGDLGTGLAPPTVAAMTAVPVQRDCALLTR